MDNTAVTVLERIVTALRNAGMRVTTGSTSARAQCPAHGSRGLTLSLRATDDRVLMQCFAGCDTADVLAELGLTLRDLFDDNWVWRPPGGSWFTPRPRKTPWDALFGAYVEHDCLDDLFDKINRHLADEQGGDA